MNWWFGFLTAHHAGPIGYAVVFLLLAVCGLGIPVPEDIILITGGYIAAMGDHPRPWPMMLVGLFGILVGDSIIYVVGRRVGPPITRRSPFNRIITPDRLERVQGMFHKYGQVILMAARFMPGVRAVAFFTAGTTKVPYYRFLAFDGSAALISAPLWVFLGYHFSGNITQVFERSRHAQHWLVGGIAFLLMVFALERYLNHRRKEAKAGHPPTSGTDSDSAAKLARDEAKRADY